MTDVAADLIKQADAIYSELIKDYDQKSGSAEQGKQIIEKWRSIALDPLMRDAVLYIGAAFPAHWGRPSEFADEARNWNWSEESVRELGVQWFIYYETDFGRKIPEFVGNKFGQGVVDAILLEVIQSSPDTSAAYIRAVSWYLSADLTPDRIITFKRIWNGLNAARRESIAIAQSDYHHRLIELPRYGGINTVLGPSKFELFTGIRVRAAELVRQPRWIDRQLGGLREKLWLSFMDACAVFSNDCDSFGEERGQVGALLQALRAALELRVGDYRKEFVSAKASLEFNHYVFSASEENMWGPDFALLFSYGGTDGILMHRYILVQTKLIKGNSIRISTNQLAAILRSSWHSSIYTFWTHGVEPRCVSAAMLDQFIDVRKPRSRPAEVSLRWKELEPYAESFGALLGDRFLSGELGDDPQVPNADSESVARRIAKIHGQPRFGILAYTFKAGGGGDGEYGLRVRESKDLSE